VSSRAVGWPHPADFTAPPTAQDLARWAEADRAARPGRLARLRDRMAGTGVDGYFGVRREHMRYLTGFEIAENEVMSAGDSGKFLVTGEGLHVLADSRYLLQAGRQAPDATPFECYYALPERWPDLVRAAGLRRVSIEAAFVSHATFERLGAAAPDVELVPVEGWLETDRQMKEPAELKRVAAACAVADRALASLLPAIRAGVTEAELALDLEWRIRTGGAEALAFDVACLAGPEAALPHGSPGDRPVVGGAVLLFDFGAQVAGYRSDMTRTLFVGEPDERDLEVYGVVAAAQNAVFAALADAVAPSARRRGTPRPSGPAMDALARSVIEADGRWPVYGHGLGHGIGIATHELPGLGRRSPDAPLPSPTVFSVEPGIYLEGEMGVRIEDLLLLDAEAGRTELLTRFPRGPVVVGV